MCVIYDGYCAYNDKNGIASTAFSIICVYVLENAHIILKKMGYPNNYKIVLNRGVQYDLYRPQINYYI